jgi:hypothetical protein
MIERRETRVLSHAPLRLSENLNRARAPRHKLAQRSSFEAFVLFCGEIY